MQIEEYMQLPYHREIQEIHDESGHYYYGRIAELDGCQSTASSREELEKSLDEAMQGYLEVCLEFGLPIALPKTND